MRSGKASWPVQDNVEAAQSMGCGVNECECFILNATLAVLTAECSNCWAVERKSTAVCSRRQTTCEAAQKAGQ